MQQHAAVPDVDVQHAQPTVIILEHQAQRLTIQHLQTTQRRVMCRKLTGTDCSDCSMAQADSVITLFAQSLGVWKSCRNSMSSVKVAFAGTLAMLMYAAIL